MDMTGYLLEVASNAITNIGIMFDEKDLRHFLVALTRLESNTRKQANEVPRLNAIDYHNKVIENIMMQAKMGGYPSYHPRYLAWKEQRSSGGFWQLAGDLVRAMTYRKILSSDDGAEWFSGVPAGIKDSGGKSWLSNVPRGKKKEIAWYGRIMEEGYYSAEQFHPERPIFGPTLKEYISSGVPLQRGDRSLRIMAREWR